MSSLFQTCAVGQIVYLDLKVFYNKNQSSSLSIEKQQHLASCSVDALIVRKETDTVLLSINFVLAFVRISVSMLETFVSTGPGWNHISCPVLRMMKESPLQSDRKKCELIEQLVLDSPQCLFLQQGEHHEMAGNTSSSTNDKAGKYSSHPVLQNPSPQHRSVPLTVANLSASRCKVKTESRVGSVRRAKIDISDDSASKELKSEESVDIESFSDNTQQPFVRKRKHVSSINPGNRAGKYYSKPALLVDSASVAAAVVKLGKYAVGDELFFNMKGLFSHRRPASVMNSLGEWELNVVNNSFIRATVTEKGNDNVTVLHVEGLDVYLSVSLAMLREYAISETGRSVKKYLSVSILQEMKRAQPKSYDAVLNIFKSSLRYQTCDRNK